MVAQILTAERLREVVEYDPDSGVFIRKIRLAQRHKVGDRADFLAESGNLRGYHRLSIDSQRYLAHRCAWLYAHGDWPRNDIDHINGDKGDNRISNLRDVSVQVNQQNLRVAKSSNKSSKMLGVHFHPQSGKWRARIKLHGKYIQVGMFYSPEEAHAAYVEMKRKLHEGCTI